MATTASRNGSSNGRSGRFWQSRAGRWYVRAGLPLEPRPDAALGPHDRAMRSLAWTEQAIGELEQPPRLLGARRLGRRIARLARKL